MESLEDFLLGHTIQAVRVEHPAVWTVAQAALLVPQMAGAKAKSLFLREGKKDPAAQRFVLVVVPYDKRVDLAGLAAMLGTAKLSLASPEQLLEVLGVEPGAVSLLALFKDKTGRASLVMDQVIWDAQGLQCHPMVNTATLSLSSVHLRRFLECTGHEARVVDVPGRPSSQQTLPV